MRPQLSVQLVQHDAGFDNGTTILDIQFQHTVEMFGEVDDETGIDGLPRLTGPAPPCCHRHARLARHAQCRLDV